MATSGSYEFTPTFDDLLQDAAGMVGGGPILAEELSSARRGLDYMLTHIQNSGFLLYKIETTTFPVSTSVGRVTLTPSILDILDGATITSNGTEIEMTRAGYQEWSTIPNKSQTGTTPILFWTERLRDSNVVNLWPVPNTSVNVHFTFQRSTEATIRAFDTIDVPRRFVPALVYGLAYYVGLRRGARVPADRLALLKAEHMTALRAAMQEDRERSSFFVMGDR